MLFMRKTTALPSAAEALPGRATPIPTAASHFVNGRQLQPPYPQGLEQAVFGLGCFWGAERKFWELGDAVYACAPRCVRAPHDVLGVVDEPCVVPARQRRVHLRPVADELLVRQVLGARDERHHLDAR